MLQVPCSDVSLIIPKSPKGVFISPVHADHFRFQDVIPEDDCMIIPPVEFKHIPGETEDGSYVIKIPHCLRDSEIWEYIKVRYGNVHKGKPFKEIPRRNKQKEDEMY